MPTIPGSIAITGITNGPVTVKATDTAAATADLALITTVIRPAQKTVNWTTLTGGGATLVISTAGLSVALVTLRAGISAPVSGAVTFEVQNDGVNWSALPVAFVKAIVGTAANPYSLSTVPATFTFDVAGDIQFRVRLSTVIGGGVGGIDVTIDSTNAISPTIGSQVVSGTVTANQGTPNASPSNAWQVKLSDGVNVPVAVKAASTAAVAADLALVVAVSPNNSVAITAASLPDVNQGNAGTNAQAWWAQLGDTTTGPVAVKDASTAAIATDKALVVALSPNNSVGIKDNNTVVPGITNLGVLPAIATAAAPVYTEGFQVGLSTDLAGATRVTGTVTASSAATATEDNPSYTEGDTTAAFSQDLEGNLRTRIAALVSDARESYITGEIKPLSLTTDGRLRISASPSDVNLDFFGGFNLYGDANDFGISLDNRTQQSFPLGRG